MMPSICHVEYLFTDLAAFKLVELDLFWIEVLGKGRHVDLLSKRQKHAHVRTMDAHRH